MASWEQRLAALETAVMGHECAGPKELIDGERLEQINTRLRVVEKILYENTKTRLDTLAAQVARIERAVRCITADASIHDYTTRGIARALGGDDGAA